MSLIARPVGLPEILTIVPHAIAFPIRQWVKSIGLCLMLSRLLLLAALMISLIRLTLPATSPATDTISHPHKATTGFAGMPAEEMEVG